jgi:PAS domain S-box-containing protein
MEMIENLKILFVEDLVNDFELALYEIRKDHPHFSFRRVDTRPDYEKSLRDFHPDIIISDYAMPLFNGMLALTLKMDCCPDIPFIMLTGSMNEETAVECMKAGADDYVIKEHIRRLPHAMEAALANAAVKKEKKLAEQELSRRELLLRNAVNNLPSSFTVYDDKGCIEYINDFGLILSDLSVNEAIGKKEEEIFPPEISRNYLHVLYRTYETKEPQVVECLINYPDSPRYVIYYFVPSLDENNNIYRVLGMAYDITERKNAEEKLQQAIVKAQESDRLKSAFLANISHEIRTPLNAIMGFSQMIKNSYNDEQLIGYADIIMASGEQLLDIIWQIIEVSQLESGNSQINTSAFSLHELMQELYQAYCLQEGHKIKRGLSFELQLDSILPANGTISSDREKLNTILRNLLRNAFKFTEAGAIVFGCKLINPDWLQFYVSDTGIGIEAGKFDLIFETFRRGDESNTRHYGGIGLGLTICRDLVTLMGGKIWVESKPGEGSVFYFTLPVK